MDTTLLIGLAGLLFSVLTYFLGVRRGKQYRLEDHRVREAQERQARIEKVIGGYIDLACSHPPQDSGPHALIRAGIRNLRGDGEIREALDTISHRTGKHPLGRDANELVHANLKEFFDALQMERLTIPNYKEVFDRVRVKGPSGSPS